MINSVKVINYVGEEMVMELRNPEKSGFLVYNMTGLGPEKAEIRTTDIVTSDGGFYNSSRLPTRNIVIGIIFASWSGKTVEEIRHESYRYFPIKKPVTLVIEGDERISEITGYVESNEPVIFTSQVYTQLSIICPYPFFYDGGPNGHDVTIFSGIEPLFEFPFSNESVTYNIIRDSNFADLTTNWMNTSWSLSNETFQGNNVAYKDLTSLPVSTTSYQDMSQTMPNLALNTTYTMSFWIKAIAGGTVPFRWYLTNITGTSSDNSWTPIAATTDWRKVGAIITFASKQNELPPVMYFRCFDGSAVYISKPMFEAGSTSTGEWIRDGESLLLMGDITNRSENIVSYSGDSEVGVTIVIDATGPVENVIIHNVLTRERMIINTNILKTITGSSIIAGDRIIISTVTGSKSIQLLRDGVYTNILNTLGKDISWFQLSKGDNIFAFEAESGAHNLFFRIENRIIYEGI